MKKFFYIILLLTFISCSNSKTIKRTTIAMGSTVEIQVRGVNEVIANKAINAGFEEVRRIDTLFSTYMTGNLMWKLNNTDADEIIVDKEFFYVLKKCDEFWKITDGCFDVTLENLIELIGFDKNSPDIPPSQKIKEALKKIGWENITLKEPNILIKPANIKLNFNACIPGYAADRIANILSNYGIKNYLINVGGEIFARGKDWKIGIQHPRKQFELLATIKVDGKGVSTSGDYEQFFKKGKKTFTHIFNPITGYPANECQSVTVIADDAMTADALSTGIFVLGPQKGIKLAESLKNVEVIIVDSSGVIYQSSNFEKYLSR
ncbi:MAG: FAD:protein FMN transferase [Melioribacter sp.]|uniref:FAD:protein FMN transferase n=1 Tax=Rosettibacter primus TaxID=3111523 RepID=UPI00247DB4FA|nr:FAD:protein FMN transferase [Melioribacter sp.]